MQILACPVKEFPLARASWDLYLPGIEVVHIDKDDLRSYWAEIEKRWNGTEDLLIIEQDIVVHNQVLPQLEACDYPWCVFPFGDQWWGLGCTRFDKEFQQHVTVEKILEQPDYCDYCNGINSTCWMHLDGKFARAAKSLGCGFHLHFPQCGHRDVLGGQMSITCYDGSTYPI